MKASIKLAAQKREKLGRGAARELRRTGRVPAIVYSKKIEPVSVHLAENELVREYYKGAFKSKLLELDVDGKSYFVLTRDIQTHPVSDKVEHLDFLQVEKDSEISVEVPLRIVGAERSVGLKRGGSLNVVRHTVALLCNPENIPTHIKVDISKSMIGDSIHISEIQLPEGVKPEIQDRDFTLVTIAGRIKAEDKAAATEEAEGEEAGEAAAE